MEVSRRTLLQAAVVTGAASVVPVGLTNSAAAAQSDADPSLSRGSAFFLNNGLVHGAWVTTDATNRWYPSWSLMSGAGFTMPVFYEQPLYNSTLMAQTSGGMWGIAKAPLADQVKGGPTPGQQLLSSQQQDDVARLGTVCFGDEDPGDPSVLTGWFQQYFAMMHDQYPNVVCHSNQIPFRWSASQLQNYVSTAQPDLLTFDNYYFDYPPAGGSVTNLYNDLWLYRNAALPGYDGTGTSPLPFGQYTSGILLNNDSTYVSESQLEVVSNVTWTMGGKWLCLFRWETFDSDGRTRQCELMNPDGTTTRVYDQYKNLNSKMASLSPHLIRLNSSGVSIVIGQNSGGPNPTPNVPIWTSDSVPYLTGVTVANTGGANAGLPGDVLFGTFQTLPGLTDSQLGPVPSLSTRYFMMANCLTASLDDRSNVNSTGGTGAQTQQQMTLTFDFGSDNPGTLNYVDQHSGRLSPVTLTPQGGARYQLVWSLQGGTSELFCWT